MKYVTSRPPLPVGCKPISELPEFVDIQYFAISDMGEVFSCAASGFLAKKCFKPYWVKHKLRPDSKGYDRLSITINGKRKDYRVHILVAKLFLPIDPERRFVNHINGNKIDNRVENLEWVTHRENIQHAFSNLERVRIYGTKSPASKLTDDDIPEILRLLSAQLPIRTVAAKFNVHHSVIYGIKKGTRWPHIQRTANAECRQL